MVHTQTIFVVGCWARSEFKEAREWLATHARVHRFADVACLLQAIASGGEDPHQIILVQARPGEFHSADVDRIRNLVPLTRVSVLLGSWCEGETRSGFPLVDVPRIAWHNLRSQMPQLATELSSNKVLPMTTSEQVRWRSDIRNSRPVAVRRIGVYSADLAQIETICETLAANGHEPLRFGTPEQELCEAIVWDDAGGARLPRIPVHEIARAFEIGRQLPILALRTFARIQDFETDQQHGVSATIAKPFQIADLLQQITFCLPQNLRKTDAA